MLNFRRERYCWIPREPLGSLRGARWEERALIAYLAKLAHPVTGTVALGTDDAFRGLAMACAVSPHERRAFRDLVPRVLVRVGIRAENGGVTLADYPGWQRTREPSRRLFATEPMDFARLPSWARLAAAELVRSADDAGCVWFGSVESYAEHHACVATSEPRSDARAAARRRILAALRALVADGFLVSDVRLRVRNFEAAQARTDRHPSNGTPTAPRRLPHVSPTSPARLPDGTPTSPARLPDGTPTSPARLPDVSVSVSTRNDTTQPAEKGPFPSLPFPSLPYQFQASQSSFAGSPSAPGGFSEETEEQPGLPGMAPVRMEWPRRKAKTVAASPPPFSVADALLALARASGGRFVAGGDDQWVRSVRVRVAGHVRHFPSLDQWRTLGAWLAQGGDKFRGVLGPAWAASDHLADCMVRAAAWGATHDPDVIPATVSVRGVNNAGGVSVESLDPLAAAGS